MHSFFLFLLLCFTITVHVSAQNANSTTTATSATGNGTQTPIYACTSNEGKPIAVGAQFNGSCNSCRCMTDGAACTRKACLNACYDDRAKGYDLEESRYDGCYQYICTPNGWSKPIQICAPTGIATSTPTNNPTILPISSTGVAISSSSSTGSNNGTTQLPTTTSPVYACTSNEGKPIAIGVGYRDKCNHCTCQANHASICTLMFCINPCYDDDGEGYALEQSRYDGCLQYICTPNGWSKPIQICTSTGVATSIPTNEPPRVGETVRTISFRVYVEVRGRPISDVDMPGELADAMRAIASSAKISSSSLVINNADFYRVEGGKNSKMGIWQIKIGFRAIQHPEGDERAQFIRQLRKLFGTVPHVTTDEPMVSIYDVSISYSIGLMMEENETIIEANEVYESQTCQDGTTISATQQCLVVTSTVASSSTSVPIAAIVAPIVGGIVLMVIIATAFIIIRRHANAVKTMEGMNREMTNFTPTEGEQHV